jgi:glucose/arabinose dehydrogenase
MVPEAPRLIPTLNEARATGWGPAGAPTAPPGFTVTRFASGLDHPRWLYVLPNGDVLAAEATTHSPPVADLRSFVEGRLERDAGANGPSPDRIMLLHARDGGDAEKHVFLSGLNQPFGMLLLGHTFYVANTDGVMAFPWRDGAKEITAPGRLMLRLPFHAGDNGHWTRNLLASTDGSRIYVSVGSSTNIADDGLAQEARRADILEIRPDGSGERIFASGLRNPVGLAWQPETHALWAVVNERDMLGNDTPPDYLTRVRDGGFYGWPWSYWGSHADARVAPARPDMVARALVPDYALGAHTAPLGLLFYTGNAFAPHWWGGAFVSLHGSWNRRPHSGYEVVYVPFRDGEPSGPMEPFLTGFLDANDTAQGRPVGLALDATGALLVADDVGGIVWRVAANR